MKKVYCIMTHYWDFEDSDCNEVVLNGVYATKEIALSYLCYGYEEEIENEMISLDFKEDSSNPLIEDIRKQIEDFGYLSFKQAIGNGRANIYLEVKDIIDFGVLYE